MHRWLLACVVVGCGTATVRVTPGVLDGGGAGHDGGASTDASTSDAGSTDGGANDAGPLDGGPPDAGVADAGPLLRELGIAPELRGVWIATVSNLDWPPSPGLGRDAGQASLDALVDALAARGFNALFFQVRPESDALYASTLEPWSRVLTGTQGQDPGWDPLERLITRAHRAGVEVHAWLNPYRGLVSASASTAPGHVTRVLSAHAITYNGQVVMDPGAPAVRRHVVSVVEDLLERYALDGVHLDDYFYPYPDTAGTPFPDDASYAAYLADGGALGKPDWRRDNVNALVRDVMATVERVRPDARFGIAPFGIWKSGTPPGVVGLSSYDVLASDSVRWLAQGWVDYLAPQLYWPTTAAGQPFAQLAAWWAAQATAGRHVFPGLAAYRLGTSAQWTASEYLTQVDLSRALTADAGTGTLHFRAANALEDPLGVFAQLASGRFAGVAVTPVVGRLRGSPRPAPPLATLSGATVTVTAPGARFLTACRDVGGALRRVGIAGGPQASFTISDGGWAFTAIAPGGVESLAVELSR